jgi:hypothetical protein
MGEWLKLIVLILLGGAAVTAAAWGYAWWMAEHRRLARAFRAGLEAAPDAALVAAGSGRGVALSLAAGRLVTAWDSGGWRMDYALAEVLGCELDLDGEVAARVLRGEPRRLLERQSGAEREVRLRFLFDDARHPDFELVLWPSAAGHGAPARTRDAIAEGNRWIARIEAVVRRSGGALVLSRPTGAAAAPAPAPRRPALKPAPPDLFEDDDDDVPWDEAADEDEFAD